MTVLNVFFNLLLLSLVCMITLIILYINDQNTGGFLNMSVKQRKMLKNQEESMQVDYSDSTGDLIDHPHSS